MQTPNESSQHPIREGDLSDGMHIARVYKRHKYVTLVVEHRDGPGKSPRIALTLHQVEMRVLVKALQGAVDAPVDATLQLVSHGGTGGVYLGGPILAESVVDPSMGLHGPPSVL